MPLKSQFENIASARFFALNRIYAQKRFIQRYHSQKEVGGRSKCREAQVRKPES
jgi:hypothetical protein